MPGIDTKSVVFGALLAAAATCLLGAGGEDHSTGRIMSQRFLVLESSPHGNPANGWQPHLIKVCPHYGKIDRESLKLRLDAETQEIKMLLHTEEGYKFHRGDVIDFEISQHARRTPGSRIIRHLPSGGQELVP